MSTTDWTALQWALQPHWKKFFQDRAMSGGRLACAALHSTPEEAANVDAVVRALARGNVVLPLSEREEDILALRLHWGWCWVTAHIKQTGRGADEETDFEGLLIDDWNAGGGCHYSFLFRKMGAQ